MRLFNLRLIVVVLFLCGCKQPHKAAAQNKQSEIAKNTYLDKAIHEYGTEKVLLALYFTTDCLNNYKKERAIQEERICSLKDEILKYYTANETAVKKCITNADSGRVLKWCLIDKNLNKVDINNEGDGSFEEVLYTMKKGEIFFAPFLKDSSQYYGSLDFEQSCTLYFNVVFFLTNAPEKENNEFLKEYYDTYAKLKGNE